MIYFVKMTSLRGVRVKEGREKSALWPEILFWVFHLCIARLAAMIHSLRIFPGRGGGRQVKDPLLLCKNFQAANPQQELLGEGSSSTAQPWSSQSSPGCLWPQAVLSKPSTNALTFDWWLGSESLTEFLWDPFHHNRPKATHPEVYLGHCTCFVSKRLGYNKLTIPGRQQGYPPLQLPLGKQWGRLGQLSPVLQLPYLCPHVQGGKGLPTTGGCTQEQHIDQGRDSGSPKGDGLLLF